MKKPAKIYVNYPFIRKIRIIGNLYNSAPKDNMHHPVLDDILSEKQTVCIIWILESLNKILDGNNSTTEKKKEQSNRGQQFF